MTLVLLAVKLLLTPTEGGVLTVVVLSPERTTPRSTDPLLTLLDGSPNLWLPQDSAAGVSFNCPMPLVSPSHSQSSLRIMVPPRRTSTLSLSSRRTSI